MEGKGHSGDEAAQSAGGLQYLPFAGLVLVLACTIASGADQYLSPSTFAFHGGKVAGWAEAYPVAAVLGFSLATFAAFAIALPGGAAILAIAGGALFGLWIGAGLFVAAATAGSFVLMLAARPAIGNVLQRKARPLKGGMARVIRDEAFWLVLSLRLMPPVPPAVTTLAAAGMRMSPGGFLKATAAGLAPGALLLGYAGSALPTGSAPNDQALWRWPEIAILLGLAAIAFVPVLVRVWWPRQPVF
jgi:uncharacterized membrane protein YdjX (TVP38/TMEM64 family)